MDLGALTFLNPTAGLIAAALSVPALIFFYMLKLRRRPARVSTVMFFSASARDLEANVPLRMIRPSWLLLLHLLIVALFCLALARPLMDAPFGASGRVVFLLDRSASMNATDAANGESRFEASKAQALAELDRMDRTGFRGEVALIDVSAEPRLRAGPTRALGEVRAAIARTQPTDDPADLAAALELVTSLTPPSTTDSGAETDDAPASAPPLVKLFSDGGCALDPAARAPASSLRIVWTAPETMPKLNAGVTAIAASRDPADPSNISVFARLRTGAGETTERTVTVACFADANMIERRVLRVPPGDEGEGISFAFAAPGGVTVRLALPTPDSLDADNRAAVYVPAPSTPRTLLVRADPVATRAGWLLEQTLREVAPGGLRVATPGDLPEEAPDLLVLDGVALPEADADRFRRVPTISFGAPTAGAALGPLVRTREPTPATWRRDHPVLRDVALDALHVASVRPVRPRESATARSTTLITGESGPWAVLTNDSGVRTITLGFRLDDTNWPLTVGFPIFLASAAEFLTADTRPAPRAFATGEPIEIAVSGAEATLSDPDGHAVSTARTDDRGEARFAPPDRVGVYTVSPGGLVAPVNLVNGRESSLAVPERLPIGAGAERGERAAAGEGPQEVWRWLVLAACALLALEWLVFALRSRR